eukprot:GHVS01074391.1.p1 GENE.GHVS01074391.1~~GHVS01074391.1.p1  ORF type:complete len:1053 (+),score=137.41 GHVS01074391.1:104-3262(+)
MAGRSASSSASPSSSSSSSPSFSPYTYPFPLANSSRMVSAPPPWFFPKNEDPFSGGVCCKLWFTVSINHSKTFCERLTLLQHRAVTTERCSLNGHIPDRVVNLLTSHGPSCAGEDGKVSQPFCSGNHKTFFPHPPTCMEVMNKVRIDVFCQCMGDLVLQNSAQLHWGINMVAGTKAESSNCVGADWPMMCPDCVNSLICDHNDSGDPPLSSYLPDMHRTKMKFREVKKPCTDDGACSDYSVSSLSSSEDLNAAERRNVNSYRKRIGQFLLSKGRDGVKHIFRLCWGYEGATMIKPSRRGREVLKFNTAQVMRGLDLGEKSWRKLKWCNVIRRRYTQSYTMMQKLHDFCFHVLASLSECPDKLVNNLTRKPQKIGLQMMRLTRDLDPEELRESPVCCSVHLDRPYWEMDVPFVDEYAVERIANTSATLSIEDVKPTKENTSATLSIEDVKPTKENTSATLSIDMRRTTANTVDTDSIGKSPHCCVELAREGSVESAGEWIVRVSGDDTTPKETERPVEEEAAEGPEEGVGRRVGRRFRQVVNYKKGISLKDSNKEKSNLLGKQAKTKITMATDRKKSNRKRKVSVGAENKLGRGKYKRIRGPRKVGGKKGKKGKKGGDEAMGGEGGCDRELVVAESARSVYTVEDDSVEEGDDSDASVQQGASSSVQQGASSSVQQGASSSVQQGASSAVQQGASSAVQQGASSAVQQGASAAVQQGASSAVQQGDNDSSVREGDNDKSVEEDDTCVQREDNMPIAKPPSERRHERDYDVAVIEYQRMWPLFTGAVGDRRLLGWVVEATSDEVYCQKQLRLLFHFMRKEEVKKLKRNPTVVFQGEKTMWNNYEEIMRGWEWSSDTPDACLKVAFNKLPTPKYKVKASQRYRCYINRCKGKEAPGILKERGTISDNEADEYDEVEEYEEFQDLVRGTGVHPSDMNKGRGRRSNPRFNPIAMMQGGFVPYAQLFQCSIGRSSGGLVHDQSYHNRYKGVPYCHFKRDERDKLGPGVNHGLVYTTISRGSVFGLHCEQAGLAAANQIVGCHLPFARRRDESVLSSTS